MNDTNRPHPLDADDDDDLIGDKTFERSAAVHAYGPLLKPCLVGAAVATLILFASSVSSIVAPVASGLQQGSVLVFRFSGVMLVAAYLGVLTAYRIAYVNSERYRPLGIGRFFQGYVGFVLANLVAIALVWLVLLLLFMMIGTAMIWVVVPLLLFAAGVLVTMSVWHKNYLRAYAIGSLTTLVLLLFSQLSMVALMTQLGGGGTRWGPGTGVWSEVTYSVIPLGTFVTLILLSGLVSAGYVVAIDATSQQPADERPSK